MKTKSSQYTKKTFSKSTPHNQLSNKIYLLPFIFITAILPFITRLHEYDTGLSVFNWFSDDAIKRDVFLYFKQVYFIITCSIMLLLIIYKFYKDKSNIKIKPILIPISLYGLLALFSTLISKYSSFGFTGIYEQFESVFVVLGYCLVIYYAFLFIQSEEDIKCIFDYFLISILVMGLLGLSQAIGHDFITTDFAEKLIIPGKLLGKIGLTFNFGPKRVYLTLYNPNYVGVYVSLIAPLLAGLLLTEKNIKKIIAYVAALAGMLISMVASQSKTSFISLFIAAIFFVVLFRKYIFRKSKVMITALCVAGTAAILFTALNFNTITNTLNSIFHITKSEPALTNIKTEENLTITYKGNDLIIAMTAEADGIGIFMSDSNFNIINYTTDQVSGYFVIDDERFKGIQVTPVMFNDLICIDVKIDGKDWYFTNQTGDNTYYYINNNGKPDKIINADSALFTGYDNLATGRGYIWSRTIPLLKNYVLLGSGADTFSMAFPQQDYVGMYNAGFGGQLITRPHNMYLQIGVQSGVLSLIALLVFYGMYFISSLRLYIKGTFDNYFSRAGVSIFIGTIAYMIAGITNDSTITVAPVFWVLIGIGITVNYKLRKSAKTDC